MFKVDTPLKSSVITKYLRGAGREEKVPLRAIQDSLMTRNKPGETVDLDDKPSLPLKTYKLQLIERGLKEHKLQERDLSES